MLMFLKRDLKIRLRSPTSWVYPLVFFLMVLALFPLAIGPQANFLYTVAPGAMWIAALLAVLLGMDGLFRSDVEDGTVEQLIVAHADLPLWALSKMLVQWLTGGVALAILSVLSMPLFGLSDSEAAVLSVSLLLGTIPMTAWGAISAALTVSLKGSHVLLPLLALPLQLPIVIFASGTVDVLRNGGSPLALLALLAAMAIVAVIIVPFAVSLAIRYAVANN